MASQSVSFDSFVQPRVSTRGTPCASWRMSKARPIFSAPYLLSQPWTSAGVSTAALPTMTRSMPLRSRSSTTAVERTPPPTWMLQRTLRGEPHDDAAVGEPAVLRAVEIDDVQPVRAERAITQQQLVRLEVVTRFRVEVALEQAHAAAVAQIDGGNEDHVFQACLQKIGEDARADHARTLGVKLRAAEVVAAGDRGEVAAVVRGGDGPVARGHGVAVHEVHVVERAHAIEQRIGLGLIELVPAHVRHGQAGRELQLAPRCRE